MNKNITKKAFHGGEFFNAIGDDFSTLEKSKKIINADVLDAWFDPSPKVVKKIKEYLAYVIKTSPPVHNEGLVSTISKYRGVPEKNIIADGGSSNLIFTFFSNILKKKDRVLILDPMYGEYSHIFENVLNTKLFRYKLNKEDDFKIDYDSLQEKIRKTKPNIVVLVNPNSPTGKYWDRKNITKLIKSVPKTIFVIDETYIEYVGSNKSLEKEAVKYKNLVVIKSMSKVYALSGVRVGYMVAHKNVVDEISPFIPPWSVGLMGQIAGIEALKDNQYYKKKLKDTHKLRNEIVKSLQDISSIKVYDSIANFFLIELKNKKLSANSIIRKLKKQDIFLRNGDSLSVQFKNDFIRIAVKDKKTNQIIIKALEKLLK